MLFLTGICRELRLLHIMIGVAREFLSLKTIEVCVCVRVCACVCVRV
jgi:hypothetical protein